MDDEQLRKIDREQLLAEKEVLEELLEAHAGQKRCGYWREELTRINDTLKGVFFETDSQNI